MKISCHVIRDILPLYAENMVSQDTRNLVEEHLTECEGCERELQGLIRRDKTVQVTPTQSLERISRIVHKRSVLSAAAAVLVMFSIGLWLLAFMSVPVFLDVEDAVASVYQEENGVVVIDYYDYVRGSVGITQPGYTQGQICYTTRWDALSLRFGWRDRVFDRKMVGGTTWWETDGGKKVIIQADENTPMEDILDQGTDRSWWYLNYRTGMADTVLWDAGEAKPTEKLAYISADLTFVALTAALVSAVILVAWKRNNNLHHKGILWSSGVLCGLFSVSVLLVTAGQTILYGQSLEQLSYIVALTVLLFATVLVFRKLRKLNQPE